MRLVPALLLVKDNGEQLFLNCNIQTADGKRKVLSNEQQPLIQRGNRQSTKAAAQGV